MVALIDTDWVRRSVMEKFTDRWKVPPKREVELRSTTRIVDDPEPEPSSAPVTPVTQIVPQCCDHCGEHLTDYPFTIIGGKGIHDRCELARNGLKANEPATPKPLSKVDEFKRRFAGELTRCKEYYGLNSTPEPDMLNTYEGWQAMGRQITRGSKAFKFSNTFALALAELDVFPSPAVSTMRFKAGRYVDVALFSVICTEASEPKKATPRRKSRR